AFIAAPASAADKRPWRIESVLNHQTGALTALSPEASARTTLAINMFGKMTIQTGCNTVFARGVLNGKKLTFFGQPWTSKKACTGEPRLIETGVLKAISVARVYDRVAKNRTVLRDAEGREVLALARH